MPPHSPCGAALTRASFDFVHLRCGCLLYCEPAHSGYGPAVTPCTSSFRTRQSPTLSAMKTFAIAVWFLFASFGSAAAADLVINGGFSTGTLAPWTSEGNARLETDEFMGVTFRCRMDASSAR